MREHKEKQTAKSAQNEQLHVERIIMQRFNANIYKPELFKPVIVSGGIGYWTGEDWFTLMEYPPRPIQWIVKWWMEIPTNNYWLFNDKYYVCNKKEQLSIQKIKSLVAKQAEDSGLWFEAQTAPESYLQQELRKLHALIEEEFGAI